MEKKCQMQQKEICCTSQWEGTTMVFSHENLCLSLPVTHKPTMTAGSIGFGANDY